MDNQKGLAPIVIVLLITLSLVTIAVFRSQFKGQATNPPINSPAQTSPTPSSQITPAPSPSSKPTYKPAKTTSPSPSFTISPSPVPATPVPTATPAVKVTCNINTSVSSGWSPLAVDFSYSASDQSRVIENQWDLDGNGTWESESKYTNYIYKEVKSYEAKLRLKLSDGSYSDTCSKTITVNPPRVTCSINADVTSGPAPLAVRFIYGASFNGVSDDYVTDVQWDFNGDGTWDTPYDYASQNPPTYTFSNPGSYTTKMHLKTNKGLETDICTKSVTVD